MQLSSTIRRLAIILAACLCTAAAQTLYTEPKSLTPVGKPQQLTGVGIDQRLDQQLPLDLDFKDENGKSVKLGDFFGKKPVVLTMVYYTCPMLCSEVETGMASVFKVLKFNPGREFEAVSVSINPNETPADAMKQKQKFVHFYGRPGTEDGLHFLTGAQPSIAALAKAVGFHYSYDAKSGQYSHATAIMVVTPQGRLAQYFYGIEYSPKDLRLALVQASQEKIGTLADVVLLYCFHYDPSTGKYSATILNILRLAGIGTVFLVGAFMLVSLKRERKPKVSSAGQGRF